MERKIDRRMTELHGAWGKVDRSVADLREAYRAQDARLWQASGKLQDMAVQLEQLRTSPVPAAASSLHTLLAAPSAAPSGAGKDAPARSYLDVLRKELATTAAESTVSPPLTEAPVVSSTSPVPPSGAVASNLAHHAQL